MIERLPPCAPGEQVTDQGAAGSAQWIPGKGVLGDWPMYGNVRASMS